MDENNYTIQFEYGGKTYSINQLSHFDFSKGDVGDKLWMMNEIKAYLRGNNLSGSQIKNARLFGKGCDLITKVDDFSKI